MEKLNKHSNYTFLNGKTAKNRVVVPPMASQTASINGFVTTKTLQHYENLTKSGAGLIFVEYSYIHPTGKSESNQLGIDSDQKVSGLHELRRKIQHTGTLAGIQIVHAGSKSDSSITGTSLLAPSPIAVPARNNTYVKPISANQDQIQAMVIWYLQAATRAVQAGFDLVELHAAHGYGLNQWLSPITNQRNDQYGGTLENRSRILFEIVSYIKEMYPSLILAVRLPGQDHFDHGLLASDMEWTSLELTKRGVDLIDVSSGIGGWRRPRGIEGQGYLVEDAARIKHKITKPVIGVGGIYEGRFIDKILMEKKVDFAAVGRAILKNPACWKQCELS